jgi:hypothetical protein
MKGEEMTVPRPRMTLMAPNDARQHHEATSAQPRADHQGVGGTHQPLMRGVGGGPVDRAVRVEVRAGQVDGRMSG